MRALFAGLIALLILVFSSFSFAYYFPQTYTSNQAYAGTYYGYPSLLGQWEYYAYQSQPYPTIGGGRYFAPGYDYSYNGYYGYGASYPGYYTAGYASVPLYGTSDLYYPNYYTDGYYSQYYGNCYNFYC